MAGIRQLTNAVRLFSDAPLDAYWPAELFAAFGLAVAVAPVLEFVRIDFGIQVADAGLHSFLRISDAFVVDAWPDLFEDELKQRARSQVADGLLQVLLKILLNGFERILLCFFG